MATVYKKADRKPIPPGAQVVTRKGRPFARYTDGRGRTQSHPLSDDGSSILVERASYYIDYEGPDGKRITVKGYPDKEATEAMARNLEREAGRIREGLIVPDRAKAHTPISQVLTNYLDDLSRQNRDSDYVYNQRILNEKLARECGWSKLSSVHPSDLTNWLNQAKKKGRSARTLNQYVETAVAFLNWCVAHRYLEANPLASVRKSDEAEKVRERRALSSEEIRRLFALPIPEGRKRAYRFALLTGLRKDEIRALQWGDLDLDSELPRIILRATCNKSRRLDVLPLHPDHAEELRRLRPDPPTPTAPVFKPVPKYETMRKDFDQAGIPHRDAQGRTADFHSLRHTYNTMLAANGVSPQDAMALMRHTDIRLTTRVYVDPSQLRLADAVGKLPGVQSGPPMQSSSHKGLAFSPVSTSVSTNTTERGSTGTNSDEPASDPEALSHPPSRWVDSCCVNSAGSA